MRTPSGKTPAYAINKTTRRTAATAAIMDLLRNTEVFKPGKVWTPGQVVEQLIAGGIPSLVLTGHNVVRLMHQAGFTRGRAKGEWIRPLPTPVAHSPEPVEQPKTFSQRIASLEASVARCEQLLEALCREWKVAV